MNPQYKFVKSQQKYYQNLQKQLKELDILGKKTHQIILLFNETARLIPQDVYLIALAKQHNNLILTGEARLNIGIVEFMENIRQSKLIQNPVLQTVKTHTINHEGFIIKCQLS